jgi:hypothetical protein
MPTFEAANGKHVWFAAASVLRVEPAEGGLTSIIHTLAPPGSPPGATLTCEVRGTVKTVGEQLDAALSRTPQPNSVLV